MSYIPHAPPPCARAAGARVQACVKEALRIHPITMPVRIASKATKVAGKAVPAGTSVHVATYAMHTDPRIWEDPDEFRPQRFVDGLSADAEAVYQPFGLGPRGCIGCAPGHALLMYGQAAASSLLPRVVSCLRPECWWCRLQRDHIGRACMQCEAGHHCAVYQTPIQSSMHAPSESGRLGVMPRTRAVTITLYALLLCPIHRDIANIDDPAIRDALGDQWCHGHAMATSA